MSGTVSKRAFTGGSCVEVVDDVVVFISFVNLPVNDVALRHSTRTANTAITSLLNNKWLKISYYAFNLGFII